MKIVKLTVSNFRNIRSATLYFEGHTLLVGANNVGKSTICEALDLLLGPDRLKRTVPVDEYDFYNATYLDEDGNPVLIDIEAVLTELSTEAENVFRRHLEFWNSESRDVLGEGQIEDTNRESVISCLRLRFVAEYDFEEDEFVAHTYYSHSPDEENEDTLTEVSPSAKRQIGFLYLRALRTGNRALSLEKGTLLDILLRIGQIRPQLWEDARKRLLTLEPPLDDSIGALRLVLDSIESRIKQYISLNPENEATRLFVSQLTREHLRKTLAFFMATSDDQCPVPFQRLGAGTLNTLVFALLSAIAELKKENVIFAMEEPEVSIPPFTQRRIVSYLISKADQSFITSHSPYVIEMFEPEQIKILRRDANANLTSTPITLSSGLKPKLFHRKLRHSIAEAILGKAVIVGEGLVECQALSACSTIMEGECDACYPMDLSGISFFDSEGDGNLSDYGAFFRSIGLKAFAFYDKKARPDGEDAKIASNYELFKETQYTGIEKLLAAETPIEHQWTFLTEMQSKGELPNGPSVPNIQPADDEVRQLTARVLMDKKGNSRAVSLLNLCNTSQLPTTIRDFLESVYSQFPAPAAITPIEIEEEERPSDAHDGTEAGEDNSRPT
jgi:putative ATP-dependent endonuclease of OLD family